MMNAQDMLKAISETDECGGLDEWLKNVLLPCFIAASGRTCRVTSSSIHWPQRDFFAAMRKLGYAVQVVNSHSMYDTMYSISIPN